MTIEEIKELIRVVDETGIAELEVQRGDNRVRIRRSAPVANEVVVPHQVVSVPTPFAVPAVPAVLGRSEAPVAQIAPAKEDERHELVKSPIVGTYYDAPSPGAPAFVKVGDRVKPKQVLCIIESMKLMNEIEAEQAGEVVAKHVESGRPVEYGELLFTIRPL
jgi:acetyl-CoA carboxylase biotin carboxyl carrier protein